jgi:hypothetical protein
MAKPVLIIRIPLRAEDPSEAAKNSVSQRLTDYNLLFIKEDIERVEVEIIESEFRQSTFNENIKK